MWDLKILGVDLYYVIAWLYLYSFLGWLWETTYVSIKEKRLVNRGFVTGPVCTIYGIGAVSVYLILRTLKGNWILMYFGGMLVATVLEYVTAVIMERLFHTGWWDYSDKKFNFQGRICLGSSVAWGFFSLIMFVVLQPFVELIVNWFGMQTGKVVLIVVTVIYIVDFTYAAMTAIQLGKRLQQIKQLGDKFNNVFNKSNWNSRRLFQAYPNLSKASKLKRMSLKELKNKKKQTKGEEGMKNGKTDI